MLLVLVILVGTAGYMAIEGWHALEALYMTVITITTVGYGEEAAEGRGQQSRAPLPDRRPAYGTYNFKACGD